MNINDNSMSTAIKFNKNGSRMILISSNDFSQGYQNEKSSSIYLLPVDEKIKPYGQSK